ncbi:prolactin-8A9-like [Acomys russatus]|uniref:prolactin-8A9-like n=1 Tax=Acomys russatus TaxID=60746 RepID=UPI0021E2432E|nr:prolactin-8A9-like [Acomys russatus]
MELPLRQLHFFTILLLVTSNLLLWEKAASIPDCNREDGGCQEPLLETINNAMSRALKIHTLAYQIHDDFFHNEFFSRQFASIVDRLLMSDQVVLTARTSCHSNITNPPDSGAEHTNLKTKKYVKMLINFVGAWNSPLFHLMIELSAMQGVPETILSKAKEMEENNRELLDDLRWILSKAYPTAKMTERFPSWHHLSFLKSNDKYYKSLAMYNLCSCLQTDIGYTIYHLRTLKCRLTGNDC